MFMTNYDKQLNGNVTTIAAFRAVELKSLFKGVLDLTSSLLPVQGP